MSCKPLDWKEANEWNPGPTPTKTIAWMVGAAFGRLSIRSMVALALALDFILEFSATQGALKAITYVGNYFYSSL